MSAGIYLITNIENGKEYVGKDINLPGRWGHHRSDLTLGKHGNPHLQRSWDKYGPDSFVYEILEVVERSEWATDKEFDIYLTMREKYHVDRRDLRNPNIGYNKLDPVVGRLGMQNSPAHCAKISASLIGRTLSEEQRANMSSARKGKSGHSQTEEIRRRISATLTGKKHTPERIARISASKKGKPWSEARRTAHSMGKDPKLILSGLDSRLQLFIDDYLLANPEQTVSK